MASILNISEEATGITPVNPDFGSVAILLIMIRVGFAMGWPTLTEDVNVEHLLDVFIMIGPSSEIVWDACTKFMAQPNWHGIRLVTLGPTQIEALPDNPPNRNVC